MRRSRRQGGNEEVGVGLRPLKPGQARGPRRLVPWWVRMLRRVHGCRRVRHQSKRGAGRDAPSLRRRAYLYSRRAVVKASFRRNRGNGAWVRHARYLARERAQHELERGRGFTAASDDIDMAGEVRVWERADDRLMWSFIISPEDADRLDLRRHVRELTAGMERDLGTRLEWVAIDHHNTDNPHVHLLIRGVRDDGRVLELDREYVSRGVRELSRELIERELGPRTEREALLARERVIERAEWTEIDRALKHRAGVERVVGYDFEERSEGARARAGQEIERLQYLEKLGLARRLGERTWELAPEHESELRRRQRERDIIQSRARERQRQRGLDREAEIER